VTPAAVFYDLPNTNMSIIRTLIDTKIDIGIHQCFVNRCSPLIYWLQMGDLNRAKCLVENGASVHRTFWRKHASGLEFVLRECTTNYLRLLLPDTAN
jgi:hypothetical protein